MAAKTMSEWLSKVRHLPQEFRDFHDQKDLFKCIWREVVKQKETKFPTPYLEGLNWVNTHIFVIDEFLRFMAIHGYTLQRSRIGFEFEDLSVRIAAMKEEEAEALQKMIRGAYEEADQ